MSVSRLIVGLTGGIGSGKSTAADAFGRLGAGIVDADEISRSLTAAGGSAIAPIRSHFGASFITSDGALDRARMRALVFDDHQAREQLEAILHPLVQAQSEIACRRVEGLYVMLVVPLLIESGTYHRRVHRLCVVDCPEPLQVSRVMSRNALPEYQVRAIIASQASRSARLALADDVIDNSGSQEHLLAQVDELHQRYGALARRRDKARR